ncbi:ANTAR domain-containing protein [Nocardia suismassiliense]|uniref:ANTAR domain-containing protein n=1 Tax=Nocardia suismassiliense TaxID=2077092 RepID=UPI000D1F0DB6|nr:ANTAR domain-containing protein [Nocardia suismassiliense]
MDTARTRLAVAELTATLATDFDVPSVLYTIARHAYECFDAFSAVLVLLDDRNGLAENTIHVVAEALREGRSADPRLHAIGPGYTSACDGAVTMISDLWAPDDTRWPRYREHAIAAGMRAVRAYPVRCLTASLGSLIVHTDDPWGTERPNEFGQVLADLTGIALSLGSVDGRRVSTRETAEAVLDGTKVIAVAIGILVEQLGLDVEQARLTLVRLARVHGVTPTEQARAIIAGQDAYPADPARSGALHPPADLAPPRRIDG